MSNETGETVDDIHDRVNEALRGLGYDEALSIVFHEGKIALIRDSSSLTERPDHIERLRALGFPIADLAPEHAAALRDAVRTADLDDTAEIVDDSTGLGCAAGCGRDGEPLIATGAGGAPLCVRCYTTAVREDERRRCGEVQARREDPPTKADPILCNRCGLSCVLGDTGEHGGLLLCRVTGGYHSTPGNGHGALDDLDGYTFSLCEFCLDWLFQTFKIEVSVCEVDAWEGRPMSTDGEDKFVPATQRVESDEWRQRKDDFRAEHDRRSAARAAKGTAS